MFIRHLEEKLSEDVALEKSVQVNSRENARLTFNHFDRYLTTAKRAA